MTTLAISENGRVLVPAALREQLGFKPGSRVHVEVKDGSLILTPASRRYAQLRAYFDSHLPPTPGRNLTDEFIAERRADAAREGQE